MSYIQKLLLGFVVLIIGAVLIVVIADNGVAVTDKKVITDTVAFTPDGGGTIDPTDVLSVSKQPSGWKDPDCPLTSFVLRNASGGSALTLNTDYYVNLTKGTYVLINSSGEGSSQAMVGDDNNTYASYTYCGDDYMNIGWGRTVIDLVAGFFALALLGAGLYLFYELWKESGLTNQ